MLYSLGVHDYRSCPLQLSAACNFTTQPKAGSSSILEIGIRSTQFPPEARLVALASFPHSGNSWLRALLGSSFGYGTIEAQNRDERAALVKTHRSPTYANRSPFTGEPNPLYFGDQTPDAVVHLVRNPLDTFFSLGILRKNVPFDAQTGYVWASRTRYLDLCLQHMEYWSVEGARVSGLRLRYEDALDDPELTLMAIRSFLFQVHRPEDHHLLDTPVNASLFHSNVRKFACDKTQDAKCLTGGKSRVGRSASCFSPSAVLAVIRPFSSTLALFGYDIRQSTCTCPSNCTCYCPLHLEIKHDRPYSGLYGADGTITHDLTRIH